MKVVARSTVSIVHSIINCAYRRLESSGNVLLESITVKQHSVAFFILTNVDCFF